MTRFLPEPATLQLVLLVLMARGQLCVDDCGHEGRDVQPKPEPLAAKSN